MNIEDAMRVDKERGGDGVAALPGAGLANVYSDGCRFMNATNKTAMSVSSRSAPYYVSNDWEPVTPKPEPVCEWCGQQDDTCGHCRPVGGYTCTRPHGHEGDHVACVYRDGMGPHRDHNISRWPQEPQECAECVKLKAKVKNFESRMRSIQNQLTGIRF